MATTVRDQGHTKDQILVDRAASISDIAGQVSGDDRTLREPDQYVTGQRTAVVHRGHRRHRGTGALGAAVVVGHLPVRRQWIMELGGVGNCVDLDPVASELFGDRPGDVAQQGNWELRRV